MKIEWTFVLFLLVVAALTAMTRVPQMVRVALTLLISYWIKTQFASATGIADPWPFFIAVDAVAARIVLHQPAGRIQSVIGGMLLAGIMVSGIYAISPFLGGSPSSDAYLSLLTLLGYLQMLLLGGWLSGRWITPLYHRYRHRPGRMAGAENARSLA